MYHAGVRTETPVEKVRTHTYMLLWQTHYFKKCRKNYTHDSTRVHSLKHKVDVTSLLKFHLKMYIQLLIIRVSFYRVISNSSLGCYIAQFIGIYNIYERRQ